MGTLWIPGEFTVQACAFDQIRGPVCEKIWPVAFPQGPQKLVFPVQTQVPPGVAAMLR
jgi:hypothetical protein